MNDTSNYQNNPLHGVGLKEMLTQLVHHYSFEILYAYLNINCFKTNPSIESSVKFLKKTDWAREKVETFYLYEYKSLPRASSQQFALSPRDRIIPADQAPGEPKELSLEDAERLQEKRAKKAAEYGKFNSNRRPTSARPSERSSSRSSPQRSEKPEPRWSENTADSESKNSESKNSESKNSESMAGSVDPWAKWKK
ncbi:MAG: VF530 family protein [Oleibacter sp.]|nr:VF530 family protein [Thalassolituus sp.]